LSALSLMCRTAILAITLVALTAGVAHAESDSAPAKPHPKTTAARSRHHAVPAQTRTQNHFSDRRRSTSHESGRTAGLVIRRKLAQRQTARRNVALHIDRSETGSRPEPQRARHFAHAAPAMEVASASPVFLFRPAPGEKVESTSARATPDAENPDAETSDPPTPDARTEEALLRSPLHGMPAPLLGSHESLERQNTRLDAEGLERIEDESDLVDRIAHKLLVPLPASRALAVNAGLPQTHRYCRPWTAVFLTDLSRAHDAAFHRPLEVSSAVRTMDYQKRLMEINGNAAPAEGDIVSPHLTGATIDIAKDGLTRDEIAWMRRHLLALETAGKIDVEEEFRQACFHITVYKDYAPPRAPRPATQAGSGGTGSKHHKTAEHSVPTAVPMAAQGL
jgi:uncharacterized protein DUF5715